MIKNILLVLLWMLFISSYIQNSFANDFTKVSLWDITFSYVEYTIWDPNYNFRVVTSDRAQELADIASQNNALTAINGVFFCPADYSQCWGKDYTINERFVSGQDLSFYDDTGERWVFGWDKNMSPFIFKTGDINADKRANIYEGMGNFPILLVDGKNLIPYYDFIELLDKKMTSNAPRHFICSDKEKTKILIGRSSSVSLEKLAERLPEIGCYDALNLDAGLSSHFIYNGRSLVDGQRNVIDAFVIQHKSVMTDELYRKISTPMKKLDEKLEKMDKLSRMLLLKKYQQALRNLRNTLYEENSVDILDNNGKNIGYTIHISDTNILKRVYLINILEEKMSDFLWKYRSQLSQ